MKPLPIWLHQRGQPITADYLAEVCQDGCYAVISRSTPLFCCSITVVKNGDVVVTKALKPQSLGANLVQLSRLQTKGVNITGVLIYGRAATGIRMALSKLPTCDEPEVTYQLTNL